ncbi:hypothetical protein TRFO_18919 [Tritrichomonas foetus]|uniref:Ubiquitin-like protease family profile domain-containing protein n=1 Tax=Tritrichomonas foetus TaxID=1144522 RepID=A0A1J4KKA8_9EUKA|nr:hypothetical protein TRFO_18919 [Tritrichomonas foetus]|eukprot:OHT11562.1 hypothetical protein TRFO_18919 [Tritrichomonas foetus]
MNEELSQVIDQQAQAETNGDVIGDVPEPEICKIQKNTIDIEDLETLKKGNKLSDAVINCCLWNFRHTLDNIHVNYTNTFFYKKLIRDGNEAASKWIKCKMSSFAHFLIPVMLHEHWFLIDLDFEEKVFNIYDSLRAAPKRQHVVSAIRKFLVYQGYNGKLKLVYPRCQKQYNNVDCGVFLLRYAHLIFVDKNVDIKRFNMISIMTYRSQLYETLSKYLKDPQKHQIQHSDQESESDIVEIAHI